MPTYRLPSRLLSIAFILLTCFASVFGQGITTSGLSGFVTDAQGQGIAGVAISVLHEPSGTRASAISRAKGQYDLSGLRIGGPYTVTAAGAGLGEQTRKDIYLELGESGLVNFTVGQTEVVKMQAFTVSAERETVFSAAKISTGSSFDILDIANTTTVRRSVQDIAQLDSRVNLLNLANNGEMSAQGQNYRFNSFLVDNVQTNDPYGLNSNGFAALRSPIPLEALQGLSVELNPYDVRRAGFTGALINAVTKSGTNRFSGLVYAEYADQAYRAKNPVTNVRENFRERTFGATFGGPILRDRLFFFLSYDDFRRQTPPPTRAINLDPNQVAQIVARAQTFGYVAGDFEGAEGLSLQKTYLGKLDWNISTDHRMTVSYRRLRGIEPEFPFYSGNSGTSFSNYWYDASRETDSYTAQVFSKWTANFRTEASASFNKYNGSAQNHGPPFPEVFVRGLTAVRVQDNTTITTGTVDLGTNNTYQLNQLFTETRNASLVGEYSVGPHTFLLGADYQRTEISNLFVPYYYGAYTFNTLADWLSGTNASFQQTVVAAGKTIADAYAVFPYTTLGLFVQDVWKPTAQLTLTAGLRFDTPFISTGPTTIPTTTNYSEERFRAAFGRASNTTNDGNYLVAPRIGFNYKFATDRKTQVRGGVGLFQGTNPAVWLANAYQNRGVTNRVTVNNATFSPSTANNNVGAPAVAIINITDPDFHSPAVWKANLALDHLLPFGGLVLTAEFGVIEALHAPLLNNLNLRPVGINPDGRIRYAGPIAATTTTGGRNNASASYTNTSFYQNAGFADVYNLTNSKNGGGNDFTLRLARPFLRNWAASLAWTRSSYREVSPMTATGTAQSFYNTRAIFNPNEETSSTSNYNIPHKIVGQLTYRLNVFKNAPSTFSLTYQRRTGRPYSWIFYADANGDGFTFNDLFYVPSGPFDPKVRWNSVTERDNFFAYAKASTLSKYLGSVVPRNTETSPWVNTFDLKFTQVIPVYRSVTTEVYANLLNVGNLLNRRWGLVNEIPFSYKRAVAATTYDAATHQYVYTFTPTTLNLLPTTADGTSSTSRWQISVGMRVRF